MLDGDADGALDCYMMMCDVGAAYSGARPLGPLGTVSARRKMSWGYLGMCEA